MAPRPAQKAKSTDALKKNAADPYILVTIADLFWRNRKVDNARSWFKRWVCVCMCVRVCVCVLLSVAAYVRMLLCGGAY
jgi:nucleoside recognition membrane protein YjiH